MAKIKVLACWRDTARPALFFFVDYRFTIVLMFWLLAPSKRTFMILLAALFFLGMLERAGFNILMFFRWFISFLGGRKKTATSWWVRNLKK